MKILFGIFLFVAFLLVEIDAAVTANWISDPRSMFPKVARTKSSFHFLHFYMATFRQMFDSPKETTNHFNYYDDQVKGTDCNIQGELDYTRLRDYFEHYARTHHNPKIDIIFAIMTKNGAHMTVEFHVTSQTLMGFEDHFHMIIRAFNDDVTGWGVRYLSMAFNC
ncbi:unnamed protein product [Caenorhabditis brenneri]